MPKFGLIRATALSATLLFAAFTVLAASQPSIALPNGHRIQRDKATQLEVTNRKGKRIIAPITGYAVFGSIVTGLSGVEVKIPGAYPGDRPLPESKEAKYFVLDTKSELLETGLSLDAWKEKLKQLGVNAPEVRAPILP
jgi:hypothetical protein